MRELRIDKKDRKLNVLIATILLKLNVLIATG